MIGYWQWHDLEAETRNVTFHDASNPADYQYCVIQSGIALTRGFLET